MCAISKKARAGKKLLVVLEGFHLPSEQLAILGGVMST